MLKGHTSAGSSLAVSLDGTTVFAGSEDATAYLWISNGVSLVIFLTTRKETATLLITDLAVSSDADVLSRSIAILLKRQLLLLEELS